MITLFWIKVERRFPSFALLSFHSISKGLKQITSERMPMQEDKTPRLIKYRISPFSNRIVYRQSFYQ